MLNFSLMMSIFYTRQAHNDKFLISFDMLNGKAEWGVAGAFHKEMVYL